MKKLLLPLIIFFLWIGFIPEAKASHLAGGEIWYEYAGTPTHPFRYDVYVIIYRDVSGVPMCPGYCPVNICITSSCWGTMNVSAPLLPFNLQPGSDTLAGSWPGSIKTPGLTDCVNASDPGLVETEAYRFYTQVDLPGNCADIQFGYSQSARNPSSNMTTSGNFTLTAKLNTVLGPNSSPEFLNPAAKSFCVGTPFIWSQAAIEPDGDSIYYDFGIPLAGSCTAPTTMSYNSGYSRTQPMTTANGINFDNKTGTLRFTATQQEVVVINITVTEYRYSTTFGGWLVVGSSVRDLQIPVVTGCKLGSQNGPKFATGSYPAAYVKTDSIKGYGITNITNDSVIDPNNPGQYVRVIPVIDYNCFDTLVNIRFQDGVYCESIDGTEFRIVGPDTNARPVTRVYDKCRPDLVTKDMDLALHKSLDIDGDYFLTIKKGINDQNTLTNICGFPLDPFFLVIIRVDDCPVLDYELKNVSVNLDREIDIDWEIDINSFSPSSFTAWRILKAGEDGQFYEMASLDKPGDVSLRSFKDTTLDSMDVDYSQYQYRVQLVQNFTAFPPTNLIHSILLKDTMISETESQYTWTKYDGWDDAAYELQLGEFDSVAGQMNWANYGGPQQEYLEDTYEWPSCLENKDTSGTYAFRVFATDTLNPANNFVSESNWVYFDIICEDPEQPDTPMVQIPTVFTPNGDGSNDIFTIATSLDRANVSIYNRWGKPVYTYSGQSDQVAWDGTDQNSGQKVSDGVYYYIIKLDGETPDGQGGIKSLSDEKTGSLTIFTNGTK